MQLAGAAPDRSVNQSHLDIGGAGEVSEFIAAHDCMEVSFYMEFQGDVNGGTIDIEIATDTDGANVEKYETVALDPGSKIFNWSAGKRLAGCLRIKNDTTEVMRLWAQKRIQ